jgi:hypothetical protein
MHACDTLPAGEGPLEDPTGVSTTIGVEWPPVPACDNNDAMWPITVMGATDDDNGNASSGT